MLKVPFPVKYFRGDFSKSTSPLRNLIIVCVDPQEMCKEIESKEAALDKLSQRYTRLAPNDPQMAARQVGPLREMWSSLLHQLQRHTDRRREFLERCGAYHQGHTSVNAGLDGVLRELDRAQRADELPLQERHILLEVSIYLLLLLFV